MSLPPPLKVDRQTTTPFLLKLFYRTGAFHRLDEFTSQPLPPHLQIYTWPTCSLRELTHLLTTALPSLLPSPSIGTRIAFRLVFPDTRSAPPPSSNAPGHYLAKDLGSIVVGADTSTATNGDAEGDVNVDGDTSTNVNGNGIASAHLDGEPERTLQDIRFVIGDYISCSIIPPLSNGAVASPSLFAGHSRGGYGGPPRGGGGYGRPRDQGNGYPDGPRGGGGYNRRGGRGGGGFANDNFGRALGVGVPNGEWRRGERIPEGPSGGGGGPPRGGSDGGDYGGGYGRGRGRGRGRW